MKPKIWRTCGLIVGLVPAAFLLVIVTCKVISDLHGKSVGRCLGYFFGIVVVVAFLQICSKASHWMIDKGSAGAK